MLGRRGVALGFGLVGWIAGGFGVLAREDGGVKQLLGRALKNSSLKCLYYR